MHDLMVKVGGQTTFIASYWGPQLTAQLIETAILTAFYGGLHPSDIELWVAHMGSGLYTMLALLATYLLWYVVIRTQLLLH